MKAKILITLKSFDKIQIPNISRYIPNQLENFEFPISTQQTFLELNKIEESNEPPYQQKNKCAQQRKEVAQKKENVRFEQSLIPLQKSPACRAEQQIKLSNLQERKRYLKEAVISLVALPKKQTLFTVLRSPHIDKKSRDQFEYKIHKQLIILDTEINQIREKLFHLKFHEIPGVQMKVVFQTKTRLQLLK